MVDLDQSGNKNQRVKTYLGPSLGWFTLDVIPEIFITAGPSYSVQSFDSRIMLEAVATPVTQINLPDVRTWHGRSSFEESLWIKDLAYKATTNPITVSAFAGQTIDGLPSFQIVTEGMLIRLYPLPDRTGWFVG